MNAWRIALACVAVIVGLCAFGFAMVAYIQSQLPAALASQTPRNEAPLDGWIVWLSLALGVGAGALFMSGVLAAACLLAGLLTAFIQIARTRGALQWAIASAVCGAFTYPCLLLAFR
jgi:hypothetical protein